MEQTEEDQRRVMGAGRFELWKQGADLRGMVYLKESPIWGGQPAVKTLEQIRMGMIPYISTSPVNSKISDNGKVFNPMPVGEYERMKKALENQGIEVFAAVDGDDLRYMLFLGAEGTYSDKRITHIGAVPSRGTFLEEIIHMKQSKDYGELDQSDYLELYAREIEANRKLLRYNKAYKLDGLDLADIRRDLSVWEQKFQQKAGVPYDESNYRGNN